MRSEREFEALVFERAEAIKAHDRSMKIIRMSVMPIAAALVVLTAVGIRGMLTVPSSTANSFDAAAGDHAAEYNERSAQAPDMDAAYDEKADEEQYSYNRNDEYDFAAEIEQDAGAENENAAAATAAADEQKDVETQMTAVIKAQSRTTISGEAANALYRALSNGALTDEQPSGGCLGEVEFSDGTRYTIYRTGAQVYDEGGYVGNIVIDESAEELLARYGIKG